MKLYRKIRKRTAKKHLDWRWKKLQYGLTLRPGGLISSCTGYNQVIEEVTREWSGNGRFTDRYVIDFDIVTTDGGSHSLTHCCETYIEDVKTIIARWLDHEVEYARWMGPSYQGSRYEKIVEALKVGEPVFLPNGCLNPDWKL